MVVMERPEISPVNVSPLTGGLVSAKVRTYPGGSWDWDFEMKAEVFIRRQPLFSNSVAWLATSSARSQPRKYR